MTVPLCCYKTVNCGWGLSDDQLLHCFPPDEDEKEKKDDPANKVGEKIEGYPTIFVPNLKWVGLVELDAGAVWRSNSHWGDSCALCKAHPIFHCLLLFNHFSSLSCRLLNKMTHCSQPIASEEGRVVLFSACQTHSRCSLALSVVRPMPRWDTCATHQNPPALHHTSSSTLCRLRSDQLIVLFDCHRFHCCSFKWCRWSSCFTCLTAWPLIIDPQKTTVTYLLSSRAHITPFWYWRTTKRDYDLLLLRQK